MRNCHLRFKLHKWVYPPIHGDVDKLFWPAGGMIQRPIGHATCSECGATKVVYL